MTYEEIFSKTKKELSAAYVSSVKENLAVEVDITGEGAGAFYIEVKDGKADIQPYEYYDRDCKLITSGESFLEIVDGKLDPKKAVLTGKLKVEGSVEKALEFAKVVENRKKAETAKKPAPKAAKSKTAAKTPSKASKNSKKK